MEVVISGYGRAGISCDLSVVVYAASHAVASTKHVKIGNYAVSPEECMPRRHTACYSSILVNSKCIASDTQIGHTSILPEARIAIGVSADNLIVIIDPVCATTAKINHTILCCFGYCRQYCAQTA